MDDDLFLHHPDLFAMSVDFWREQSWELRQQATVTRQKTGALVRDMCELRDRMCELREQALQALNRINAGFPSKPA
ncbi:hypothetical protein ACU635_14045 [[Actinomadura] parvosata]|uniref:hypothetical protein n=1 Tax=[Actinomadura] parvosata TaxID=1955412 RepID=UPI00406C4CF8